MNTMVENLRIPPDVDICAMTKLSPCGVEYICIKPRHPKVYERRAGGGYYEHYMVKRWPYRDQFDPTIH